MVASGITLTGCPAVLAAARPTVTDPAAMATAAATAAGRGARGAGQTRRAGQTRLGGPPVAGVRAPTAGPGTGRTRPGPGAGPGTAQTAGGMLSRRAPAEPRLPASGMPPPGNATRPGLAGRPRLLPPPAPPAGATARLIPAPAIPGTASPGTAPTATASPVTGTTGTVMTARPAVRAVPGRTPGSGLVLPVPGPAVGARAPATGGPPSLI